MLGAFPVLIFTSVFHSLSFNNIHIRYPCLRSCEVFSPSRDPSNCTYKCNHADGGTCIIHIILSYWVEGREIESNRGEQQEDKTDDIQYHAPFSQCIGAWEDFGVSSESSKYPNEKRHGV